MPHSAPATDADAPLAGTTTAAPAPPPGAIAGLRVLASGSQGNCSVLLTPDHRDPSGPRRVTLIDAGLSPARTRRLLADCGIHPHEVDEIVLTHLDTDHCHSGWAGALRTRPWRCRVLVHARHYRRAERAGLPTDRLSAFDDELPLGAHGRACVHLGAHDNLGVASFRFDLGDPRLPATVGFATDLGRVTDALLDLLAGVDLLAIESNYCPRLQAASDRPEFLKRRITGGAGHLSNRECADAVRAIAPRSHVVLLHLSQQCNRPALAAEAHEGRGYTLTLTGQHRPSRWVWASAAVRTPRVVVTAQRPSAWTLFDASTTGTAGASPR
jgi:phosphoribosyl 1,2-cyclic phosphodiesterase